MAHNLHYVLVHAEDYEDANNQADALIEGFGNDNNWYSLGAILRGDGTARDADPTSDFNGYSISDISGIVAVTDPKANLFDAVIDSLNHATQNIKLRITGDKVYHTVGSAQMALSKYLMTPNASLYTAARDLDYLSDIAGIRAKPQPAYPTINEYKYDEYGLTDHIGYSETPPLKEDLYIVCVDMHS